MQQKRLQKVTDRGKLCYTERWIQKMTKKKTENGCKSGKKLQKKEIKNEKRKTFTTNRGIKKFIKKCETNLLKMGTNKCDERTWVKKARKKVTKKTIKKEKKAHNKKIKRQNRVQSRRQMNAKTEELRIDIENAKKRPR